MKDLLDIFLYLLKQPIIIMGLIMFLSNICFIEFLKEFRNNDKDFFNNKRNKEGE